MVRFILATVVLFAVTLLITLIQMMIGKRLKVS